jgi:hypothetical protein
MNKEKKDFLIILAIVALIVLGFILSGIFLKQEPKGVDENRPPVNRIEKIREGFSDK